MALAQARPTRVNEVFARRHYPVAASTTIYAGSLVMLGSDGYARPAAAAAGNKGVVGVAAETVRNTGANGLFSVVVAECEALFENDGGAACVQATAGSACYASDDQTVANADGGNYPRAGFCVGIVPAAEAWAGVAQVVVRVGLAYL